MKKLLALGVALLIAGGVALAQTIALPTVVSVASGVDLIQIVPGGVGHAGNQYTTANLITNVPGYHFFGTITTDPGYTIPNGITNVFAHAAGTITLVTLTTPANPGDGARACWYLDQTTTTLTWTANTGQTIGANVHAAGVTNTPNCITYQASSTTWFSSP